MKRLTLLFTMVAAAIVMSGCMSTQMTMTKAIPEIELKPEHIEVSQPLEATAVTTKVFGVDWSRLFSRREADIRGSVYSTMPGIDKTDQYAIYSLLKQNEGYDMVMYPKFTTVVRKPFLGIGFIIKVTEVKVTARMAKLKL